MTIRIGLIGAGGMGRAHLARIANDLSGAVITAVADINHAAAVSAAEPYGAKAYDSSDALINDPEVDAVVIATFGKVHAPDVIKCVAAGKYVLCEKPLATTAEDCLRIMETEQRAGKRLVTVGFMRRFDAGYQEMKALLDSGEHGYATLVHCRHRNPSVPENYTTRNMIDDTAIHEIDVCRFLLGEEITSVRVDTPRATSHRFEHLQDPLVLVARTASGVLIDDEVNVNIQFGYSIECELVMETGTVRLGDQEKVHVRDLSGNRNAMCQSHIDRFQTAFNTEFQSWINAVARDEHTGSTSWDGYAATCVVDAGLESLENGGREVAVSMIDKPAFYA
ncbi:MULTISPECIES: Gfo/Idh/MocA family oxidoreductase [unclassified Actinomyces]|uniref:Gfo/Idh/MocA family protein n=1 Tax=unclassified Actinomyces TaxID=2609248 RepID=UPI002017F2C2|nr:MULTISPECIES: Gfo/Idh/MocA family oxidoreductase [unclassified Actinomyces]MCL3777607.1 Gfo/Idh/MocA family oxidoreductase [Actinomyces sp. AC-20-1]MCL3789427.1 Gfo/Idh/MocA family oxidoreductase [Actinomyces sp. 187325]MCL3791193.1 Gfo/Idh/MocA family oxidoreductase [Actinomyces sp. 186855]MCL3794413.1 Gfo/Idh/MocA family oxidoreductase [Actinomyces sp. 217892]